MGCCWCCPSADYEPLDKRITNIPVPAGITDTWKTDLESIFSRSILQLPVHIDIPRLYRKIRIFNNSGKELTPIYPEDAPHSAEFLDLIAALADSLQDFAFKTYITTLDKETFFKFDDGTGLHRVFEGWINAHPTNADSKTVRVMKLLCQKPIFPAYYRVKYALNATYLKDSRNTWRIDVIIVSDNIVSVQHRKRQQMGGLDDSHPDCEFTFGLNLDIDLESNTLTNIAIEISEPYIDPSLPVESKAYYHDMLDNAMRTVNV